jgi:succinate dehydrogenase/fumarate reductase flavoprotein subunit
MAVCSQTVPSAGFRFRTFYARGQTGQQLLLGAYQALEHEIAAGSVKMFPRTEMLDLVLVNGHAKGIVVRNLVTGEISSHAADTVVLAAGGYGNVLYLSTNAKGCNVTATWRDHKRGALFANPCSTQIHPTCIPVSGPFQAKLTLMSESLQGLRLHPDALESAQSLPGIFGVGIEQQLGRERDAPGSSWAAQLDTRLK